MKRIICFVLVVLAVFALGACRNVEMPEQSPTPSPTPANAVVQASEASVYIGRGEDYEKYNINYEGTLTADMIIEKMASLTGWNLTLSEPVISGKAGMIIDFSKESSVYTGRAGKAKDDFEIDDKDDLIATILDSVTYTLKRNFVAQPNDTTVFEVVYSVEGEDILVGSKTVDKTKPYSPDIALKYDESRHVEFLTNRLSNYYDTPNTDYVKYGEHYDDGELYFIYRAIDKKTGEVLGMYKFPSDLDELSEKLGDGDYEEIWDRNMFGD